MSAKQQNNFTLIRYLGAIFVIFSHSYPLTYGANTLEPLTDLTGGLSIGAIGVSIFFIISGFLLVESWKKDRSINFFWRRAIRIFPELIGVVLFTIFIIGPLTTNLDVIDYFNSKETWSYFTTVTIFFLKNSLPGVFENNPFPNAVNGSLWILPYFLIMYAILFIYGALGFINRPRIIIILHILVFVIIVFYPEIVHMAQKIMPIHNKLFLQYYLYFSGGIILSLYREYIKKYTGNIFCFVLILLGFAAWYSDIMIYYIYIAVPYIVIYVSICSIKRISKYSGIEDYTYGMYIYAWPTQQTIIHFMKGISVHEIFILSVLVTIPLAILSRHIIEKHALKLKRLNLNKILKET